MDKGLIIGYSIVAVFLVFRYLLPYNASPDDNLSEIEELRFKKVNQRTIFIFLFILISLTLAFTFSIDAIRKSTAPDPQTLFQILPDNNLWGAVGILLAIALSVVFLHLVLRLQVGKSLGQFWMYYNKITKFRGLLIINVISVVSLFLGLILLYRSMAAGIMVNKNEIVINELFSNKRIVHPYSAVSQITHYQFATAPNGNIINKPHYTVRFSDGYKWSTLEWLRDPKESDAAALDFIVDASGITMQKAEVDE